MAKQALTRLWPHSGSDSLFRNSAYLMLSTSVLGGLGFIFWILATHFYTASDVGLATSLLSAAGLMVGLSTLGLNNVLIRFLAHANDRQHLLSAALTLTATASAICALGFLAWAAFTHSPLLSKWPLFVGLLFVPCVITLTLNNLIEGAFIAHRVAKYVLAKNLCLSLVRLVLPIPLVWAGYVGLVAASTLATAVSVLVGLFILVRTLTYHLGVTYHIQSLVHMRTFAVGNYIGGIFGMLPATLMPLIILSRLGPSEAAYYYIPAMVIALMNVIPSATAQSLFAEASHNEGHLRKYVFQALRNLCALLIPATIVVALLARIVLALFGSAYASHGTTVLQILALSSLFGGMNFIGDAILNIQKRPFAYVVMNALNSILVVGLGYIVSPHGLVAIALAALFGQTVTVVVYALLNIRLMVQVGASY